MTESHSASSVRLSVGALIRVPDSEGRTVARVVAAGQPLPFEKEEDIPEALRGFIVAEGDDAADALDPLVTLNRQLGERYGVDGRLHRRGRALARQAAIMEAEAEQEEREADERANTKLPEATVEQLEDSHSAYIARQLAEAEILARRGDELHEHLLARQDEQQFDANGFPVDEQVSVIAPTPAEERENADEKHSTRHRVRRYVKRGSSFKRAEEKSAKLEPGEPVFVKHEAGMREIGVVDDDGSLPVAHDEEEKTK